ncbi:MAG TPA: high-affinity nickel-transport family protein, partial [Bacteroidota bacterium]|nr:high-affinity nickel-transport family protein [Bacteroidota bacterium]
EKVAQAMEFCVALMLIALGANVVWSLLRGRPAARHTHSHGIFTHTHARDGDMGAAARSTGGSAGRLKTGPKPILIGMVHGLAGSAALMLVVLATIPSPSLGLLYIGIFGVGSVGGMMLMSTLLGLPFAISARRFESLTPVVRAISGTVSLAFGLFLTWQIGIMQGLFL